MLIPCPSKKFKQDYDRMTKRGKDIIKLDEVIVMLLNGLPLSAKHRDHQLKGKYLGFRDCHVEGDRVLIYAVKENDLILFRTGTHSDVLDD